MSSLNVDTQRLYEELLEWYRHSKIGGEALLKKDLEMFMSQGLSREDAIKRLYVTIFGETRPIPGVSVESALEVSLRKLREKTESAGALIIFLIFISFILFAFSPPAAAIMFSLGVLAIFLLSLTSTTWSFRETLRFEKSSSYLNEVINEVPSIYQEIVLEDIKYSVSNHSLSITFSAGGAVRERSGRANNIVYAELGVFSISADFGVDGEDLVVNVVYSGSPPSKYIELAAEAYEKYVVGFRVAVRKAIEKVRPKVSIRLEFDKLVKLLSEKGIIVKEVKCPKCGAPVRLPGKGEVTVCKYCGATLTVYDVLKIIKKTLSEFELS